MIGQIVAVGRELGRWMFVTRVDDRYVHGRIWKPIAGKWSQKDVFYPRGTVGAKAPSCPMPKAPSHLWGKEVN
jgi:hypothetical protein